MKHYTEVEREAMKEVIPYAASRLDEAKQLMIDHVLEHTYTDSFSGTVDRACQNFQALSRLAAGGRYSDLFPASRIAESLTTDYMRSLKRFKFRSFAYTKVAETAFQQLVKERGAPDVKRRYVAFVKKNIDQRLRASQRALDRLRKERQELEQWGNRSCA